VGKTPRTGGHGDLAIITKMGAGVKEATQAATHRVRSAVLGTLRFPSTDRAGFLRVLRSCQAWVRA